MGESRPALFRGRHFREEIIVLCLRWYLRYPLSYRNLEEMMTERGLSVDHSTIARWVLALLAHLERRGFGARCGIRTARGAWTRLTSASPVAGHTCIVRSTRTETTIDFRLSLKRDYTAAKTFLRLALRRAGAIRPRVINVDGHPAYLRVIKELKRTGELGRPVPLSTLRGTLNNIIEQDHRFVKKASGCKSVVPLRCGSTEYDRRIRSNEHHSQGTDSVVFSVKYLSSLTTTIFPYRCLMVNVTGGCAS